MFSCTPSSRISSSDGASTAKCAPSFCTSPSRTSALFVDGPSPDAVTPLSVRTVRAAAAAAEPGDVVLMSPASAAFDQFKNFMVRGAFFKKLVKEL